jgi:hypothetical protein
MTSAASSLLFDADGIPIEDPYADITCSDTDCSWISEDSDYSSIFSLFEEEMEPTKWMVKFNKWIQGGDIYDDHDGRESEEKEEEEKDDDDGGKDKDEEDWDSDNDRSAAPETSVKRLLLLENDPDAESESAAGTCTPSKYAVTKDTDLEETISEEKRRAPIIRISYRRQVSEPDESADPESAEPESEAEAESKEDGPSTNVNFNVSVGAGADSIGDEANYCSSPDDVDADSPRSVVNSNPETERVAQFSQVQRRFLHREMLPVRTPSELELDAAETEEMKPIDPAIHMQRTDGLPQPGSVEWRELTRAAKAAWRSWGWNHENWNDIIKKRDEEAERQRNLKAWRKDERKYRRQVRKERRINRGERRKIREERKLRNRRGGRMRDVNESASSVDHAGGGGSGGGGGGGGGGRGGRNNLNLETVEVLIKRIMARAEREQEERDRKAAADNAVRHAAKLAAIGIDPSVMSEEGTNKPKVEEVDFDLELRERPWNSRSHADRSDILYRSLYRPFTKNV